MRRDTNWTTAWAYATCILFENLLPAASKSRRVLNLKVPTFKKDLGRDVSTVMTPPEVNFLVGDMLRMPRPLSYWFGVTSCRESGFPIFVFGEVITYERFHTGYHHVGENYQT